MNINIGNTDLHFQVAPLYGVGLGYIYYDPELDQEEVEEEEYFQRHQFLFLIFALIVTVWKS
jgi:hypothetical protein